MNIIECINRNLFLKNLFPDGLTEDVLRGQLELKSSGTFGLNIHTFQQPSQEIKKWGVRGQDYEVIVIKLLGSGIADIGIKNWKNITYAKLDCQIENSWIHLSSSGQFWEVGIYCQSLTFQGCETYLT
jgi:hypothetical protein